MTARALAVPMSGLEARTTRATTAHPDREHRSLPTAPLTGPSRRRLLAAATNALVVAALAACADAPTGAPRGHLDPAAAPAGVVRLTIAGIGTEEQTSTIAIGSVPAVGASSIGPRASRAAAGAAGAAQMTPSRGLTVHPDNAVQYQLVSTGSYTFGARNSAGAFRYVYATFRVRNNTSASMSNVALLAVSSPTWSDLGGSAINTIRLAGNVDPGVSTATTLARGMMPAGSYHPGRTGLPVALRTDVLQIYSEAEVAAAAISAPATALPYGFSVIDTLSDGRTLGTPPAGSSPAAVTFAYVVPLQPTAAQDIYAFSVDFVPVTDGEARVTESLEERTTTAGAAVLARATAVGAVAIHTFRGTTLPSTNKQRRVFCSVRTAGTRSAPTAVLGSSCASEIDTFTATPTQITLAPGATQQILANVVSAPGCCTWAGVAYASANNAVATVSATGLVTAGVAGTTTIYVGPHGIGERLLAIPVTVQ